MARKKGNPHGMTDQQYHFAQLYKADPNKNATAAYRKAYPKCKSDKAASEAASRLTSRNVKVQAYLQEATDKAMKKFDVTEERIIQELACIAFLDISDLMDDQGGLLPIGKIPEHARRAIAGMDLEELFDGKGEDRGFAGLLKKLKITDKKGALELLGRNKKMFTDKIDHAGVIGMVDLSDKTDKQLADIINGTA